MTFKKTAETLLKDAHTLDRDYYVNPEILKKEYKNIFLNNWICAGRTSEIKEPGEYKIINLNVESVIALRDETDNLKAYYNVCRHRGTRICEKLSGKFSKSIQCGYHGWTYGLNGSLIGAPHMEKVGKFNKKDYHLHPVSIREWEGFIFINLSEEPENFDSLFEPLINRFSSWKISELIVKEKKSYNVKGNWKLVIQNFSECYHCPILHPDLAAIHNYMGGRNDLYEGPFLGGYMDFNNGKKSITSSGELCAPPIEGLDKADYKRVYYYSIFPNMLLSLHPEYVMYHTISPNGVDQCTVTCSWLFPEKIANSKNYNTHDAIEFWNMTNKQDWYISELSQLGIQSKKYSPAPYSGQESLLAEFDRYYLENLG